LSNVSKAVLRLKLARPTILTQAKESSTKTCKLGVIGNWQQWRLVGEFQGQPASSLLARPNIGCLGFSNGNDMPKISPQSGQTARLSAVV
jgi:hypothetical protein